MGSILRILGALLLLLAVAYLPAVAVALADGTSDVGALLTGQAFAAAVGALLVFLFRRAPRDLDHRQAFIVVTLIWTVCAFFAAIPFMLSPEHFSGATDSYFEAMSGLTTTGATILSNIEALPRGLLLWRSEIQWLGGMGIIVLSIAILPLLGVGGMQLYRAEATGPVAEKLRPRITETAKLLWGVYLVFTALCAVLLFAGGLSIFDAVCHAFTTLSSGGFSTRNQSLGAFPSAFVQWTAVFFMLLAGINYSLSYLLIRGRVVRFYRNSELRFFMAVFVSAVIVLTYVLQQAAADTGVEAPLRTAAFQAASILTTTGYTTADYALWPAFGQFVIFGLFFFGGSAGSTAGGIKCIRVLLLLKQGVRELRRLIHPHAVLNVKIGKRPVGQDVIESVWGFFFLYAFLIGIASIALSALGLDFKTALTSTASAIGNIGPAFGDAGPAHNYAGFPGLGKWILCFCMVLGRLEIYTVIVLFLPDFWRK